MSEDDWDKLDQAIFKARMATNLTLEWIGRGLGLDEGQLAVEPEDADLTLFIAGEAKLAVREAAIMIEKAVIPAAAIDA